MKNNSLFPQNIHDLFDFKITESIEIDNFKLILQILYPQPQFLRKTYSTKSTKRQIMGRLFLEYLDCK